ncbi:glycosyltransferase family 4 protein [Candidatus Fermentibacteria bacterium]|nr:glycosyltransferase family 4 protein [Candidatus Fermentibacteria bacterium]
MERRTGASGENAPRLSILMVHPHDLYSPQEPWTVRIRFLAEELARQGHRVILAYHRLGATRRQRGSGLPGVELVELGRNVSALVRNTAHLAKMARACDVVHVQKCMPHAAIPALWAAYLNRLPIHYDWDDWEYKIQDIETGGKAPGWLRWMEERLPGLVDTVSVASGLLEALALKAGVPKDRIFRAPVGADLVAFNPAVSGERIRARLDGAGPVVLYLGQLHATQYVGQFLQAGKLILTRHPDARLVVVGAGWRLPELEELASTLHIVQNVVFTGAVPYAEVPEYVAAADVAVACFDDNEATRAKSPLKVVEYLAAGKAIVASAVGEVQKMIDQVGVLVPAGDIPALSDAICDLLEDPFRREELGLRARERAERLHGWGAVAANLEQAYRRALQRPA